MQAGKVTLGALAVLLTLCPNRAISNNAGAEPIWPLIRHALSHPIRPGLNTESGNPSCTKSERPLNRQ